MRASTLRRFGAIVIALAVVGASGEASGQCPPRILTRLGQSQAQHRDLILSYWKHVPPGSEIEEGIIVAFEAAGDRGPEYVSGIIEVLSQSSEHFRRLATLRSAAGLSDEIAAMGSRIYERVVAAAGEVRFAADRLGADSVESFQFVIPGSPTSIPDIRTKLGDLYEIKFRSWTDAWPAQTVEANLEDVLAQVDIQQRFALSEGRQFTLAFEVPIPEGHRALFETVFAEFLTRPNVTVVNGF